MVSETSTAASPAHPRVCGENTGEELDQILDLGSSPRVRGKLEASGSQLHEFGLIPACAGKTLNDLEF